MKYCNHVWSEDLYVVVKMYRISGSHKQRITPICINCGMLQVYHEHITKLLRKRKPCKCCGGRGYI